MAGRCSACFVFFWENSLHTPWPLRFFQHQTGKIAGSWRGISRRPSLLFLCSCFDKSSGFLNGWLSFPACIHRLKWVRWRIAKLIRFYFLKISTLSSSNCSFFPGSFSVRPFWIASEDLRFLIQPFFPFFFSIHRTDFLKALFRFDLPQGTRITFQTDDSLSELFPINILPVRIANRKICSVGLMQEFLVIFCSALLFSGKFDQNQTSSILPLEFPLWIRLRLYLFREMTPIFTVIWVLKVTYLKMAPCFSFSAEQDKKSETSSSLTERPRLHIAFHSSGRISVVWMEPKVSSVAAGYYEMSAMGSRILLWNNWSHWTHSFLSPSKFRILTA